MNPKEDEGRKLGEDNVDAQTKLNRDAFVEAESDIEQDHELRDEAETGDDLDEGELARLEGEE